MRSFAERGECLPHRMDDDFLIRFLRARNFNVKRAHRLVSYRYIGIGNDICDETDSLIDERGVRFHY